MILIAGCGFLGSYIAKYARSETNEAVVATVHSLENTKPLAGVEYIRCDVTKKSDLAALSARCKNEPLTVFYLAACHNVDYVFENPEEAYRINVEALGDFFGFFPNIRKFFFASTDCVYGDSTEKFSEASPTEPVNEYGRQKLEAEKTVTEKGFTVLRYPFMLGASLTSKPHFYDNICKKLKSGETVEMIDGMHRSVLSYSQAAEYTFRLSELSVVPKTVNLCSDEALSKYDIGLRLAKKLGLPSCAVKRISEDEGSKFFRDKRASCALMDNTLLKTLLNLKKIKWEDI